MRTVAELVAERKAEELFLLSEKQGAGEQVDAGLPKLVAHAAGLCEMLEKVEAAEAAVVGERPCLQHMTERVVREISIRRGELDDRLNIEPAVDAVYTKRMPSAFHETALQSLLIWHQVDTVVVTGGSTSGCVRATAVESLSRGYRTIVPIECVADKHESYHYANLTDLSLKYADVVSVQEVFDWLDSYRSDAQ